MTQNNPYGPIPGPPPGGQWPVPPNTPAPVGKSKALKLTLIASAAVLAVVGIIVAVVLGFGSKGGSTRGAGSAGDAVKSYLEALSRGDAEGALALSDARPATTKFLTDDALKLQIATWPITNIQIRGDTSTTEPGDIALVATSADFGDQHSEAEVPVVKTEDGWKLKSATINLITLSGMLQSGPSTTLSMLGQPIGKDNNVYVFPGFLDLKSMVPFVDVVSKPLLLESMAAGDVGQPLNVDLKINDVGRKAVDAALEKWIVGCVTASRAQAGCPDTATDDEINWRTATITGPIDLSEVKQGELLPMSMKVMENGTAHFPFTAQTTSGRTGTFTANIAVAALVDLSTDPPTIGR